jgi:hypothetical protein
VIGLNVLQSKDIEYQTGLKNKTQLYVACKGLISLKKVNTGLESKGRKKVYHTNGPHKQAGVAIFISDKMDFRLKSIRRDNEDHFIIIKGTLLEKNINP